MTYLPDFSKTRVIVVGDVMLDRYYTGSVARISPEAPVPVVNVQKKTYTVGGAGYVALNLKSLGACPLLLGVRGDDSPGTFLMEILTREGVENHLVVDARQPTSTKTRIIGQGQQIVRLDEEKTEVLPKQIKKNLLDRLESELPKANAVILSDYGKGVFLSDLAQELILRCRDHHLPVFVDPKGTDWIRYQHAHCITPNESELKQVVPFEHGDDASMAAGVERLMTDLDLRYLMVTRGAKGISLFARNEKPVHIPTRAREVFDVTGAGDTVIAVLAAAFGSGKSMPEAARLANLGAGIAVGKLGTQPVSRIELRQAVASEMTGSGHKVLQKIEAEKMVAAWKKEEKSIVFTNGCFDILHIGHIQLLHAAAAMGDKLVIGINSDQSVKRLKGDSRPIISEKERAATIAGIEGVDMVVIFHEDTPIELINAIKPDVLVKGGDYTPETVVGREIVENNGGKVVIFPLVKGASTTDVINKMKLNRSE